MLHLPAIIDMNQQWMVILTITIIWFAAYTGRNGMHREIQFTTNVCKSVPTQLYCKWNKCFDNQFVLMHVLKINSCNTNKFLNN